MGQLRVLIGDERGAVTARLAVQLEGLGHRVIAVAKDGRAVLEYAWRLRPDVILLDARLPPVGGIDAARVILTRHVFPIILLSGYSAAETVRRAQEAGVLGFLAWPADARALESALRVALGRFRELRVLVEQEGDPQHALRTRLVVERAKKLLMRRLWLGETESFDYMRRRSGGTPLGGVAGHLLTLEEALFGKPGLAGCVDVILGALAQSEALGPLRVA